MGIAKLISERSTCLSRKVGCVIVDNNDNVIATGYNGPPRGQKHCDVCVRKAMDNLHFCRAVHAEQNALLQCKDVDSIAKVYVTASPCNTCIKMLLNTSCKEVIYLEEYHDENQYILSKYDFSNLKVRQYNEQE